MVVVNTENSPLAGDDGGNSLLQLAARDLRLNSTVAAPSGVRVTASQPLGGDFVGEGSPIPANN